VYQTQPLWLLAIAYTAPSGLETGGLESII